MDAKGDVKFANKSPCSNNDGESYFRAPDAGLNVGIGGKIDGLRVQLTYDLGLSNLLPNRPDGTRPESKLRNRGFQLTAGCFFGGD